jgi:tetratricopeptide (TPR) repeat protein
MNPTPPPTSETARPYHQRWAEIFVYPLQPGPLSTNVALALSHLVAHIPLGFILDLLVWTAFFKYAFEVLRWSANGREQAPEISFTVGDGAARFAMLLLVLSEVAILMLAYIYGTMPAFALGVALMFAMPAMITILAVDENILAVLNPFAWIALAMRLRGTYLVLVGFFCAALFVQSIVAGLLSNALPAFLVTPLVFFVVNYLMIANFHLIGWVIHEHADELGYSGHLELHALPADAGPDERIIEAARRRAASGDVPGALALLRDEIGVRPEALALHAEFRHWLREAGENAELVGHGRRYIEQLLAFNQDHGALEAARDCLAIDPGFTLDKGEDVTRLAASAAAAGRYQLVLQLLTGFHKHFRNHADIAKNYLLAAKIMAERMNKEMQARALLQQIKIVLPEDPLIAEVDGYLAFLDKLAATPTKASSPPRSA